MPIIYCRWVGAPQHKDGHRLSRTSLAGLGAGFTRASFGRTPTLKLLLGAMGSEERPEWTLVKERRRPAGHRAAAGSAGRSRIATVTKTSVVDRKAIDVDLYPLRKIYIYLTLYFDLVRRCSFVGCLKLLALGDSDLYL